MRYVHVRPTGECPDLSCERPFRAVVIIDDPVTPAWRWAVSQRLVADGCLYMMAWGLECTTWDDSVDFANLEQFDYGDIPDEAFVMTTWHENESLDEVLGFCRHLAHLPGKMAGNTVILHIAEQPRADEITAAFARAGGGDRYS